MNIEEVEDIVNWNLSFDIPIQETLKELKIKKESALAHKVEELFNIHL